MKDFPESLSPIRFVVNVFAPAFGLMTTIFAIALNIPVSFRTLVSGGIQILEINLGFVSPNLLTQISSVLLLLLMLVGLLTGEFSSRSRRIIFLLGLSSSLLGIVFPNLLVSLAILLSYMAVVILLRRTLSEDNVIPINLSLVFILLLGLELLVLSNYFFEVEFSVPWSRIELDITNLSYPLLTPLFLMIVLLSIILVPVSCFFHRNQYAEKTSLRNDESQRSIYISVFNIFLLSLAIIVSVTLAYIPISPSINPEGILVGKDAPFYYEYLSQNVDLPLHNTLSSAFQTDRPLFLLSLVFYAKSLNLSHVDAIQYLPVILLPIYVLTTFALFQSINALKNFAGVTALLTASSIQATAALFAGFYPRVMALSFLMISITLFLHVGKKKYYSPLLLISSILLLLSHTTTWIIFTVIILMFLLVSRYVDSSQKLHEYAVGTVVLITAGFVLEVVRITLFNYGFISPTGVTENVYWVFIQKIEPTSIVHILGGLTNMFASFLGGAFAFPLPFWLSIWGLVVLSRRREPLTYLIFSWMFSNVLLFLLLPSTEYGNFLFYMPIPILASIGLYGISTMIFQQGSSSFTRYAPTLIVISWVITVFVNYGLRFVENIVPTIL